MESIGKRIKNLRNKKGWSANDKNSPEQSPRAFFLFDHFQPSTRIDFHGQRAVFQQHIACFPGGSPVTGNPFISYIHLYSFLLKGPAGHH